MQILMLLSKKLKIDTRVLLEKQALEEQNHNVFVLSRYKKPVNKYRVILSNILWWVSTYRVAKLIYKGSFKFDVVHCHDLDTLQIGIWLKRKLGVKLVYDAHEIFGYMIQNTVPNFVVKLVFYYEKKAVKKVDYIVTVTKPLVDYFKSITDKPIFLVMNCKNRIIDKFIKPNNKIFTLIYIGSFHKRRCFPELISFIGYLNASDINLMVAGKKENLKMYNIVKKESTNFENIKFLGELDSSLVLKYTLKADAVISLLDSTEPCMKVGITTKIFDAISCGRPIITTNNTYSGEFVIKNNIGLTINYNDFAELKKIIYDLINNNNNLYTLVSRNSWKLYKKYNWDNQQKNLFKLYKKIWKVISN